MKQVSTSSSNSNFVYIMFFSGLILVYLHVVLTPPPPLIEYRYLPPDLDTLFKDAAFNSDKFTTMFDDQGPWIQAHTSQKLN